MHKQKSHKLLIKRPITTDSHKFVAHIKMLLYGCYIIQEKSVKCYRASLLPHRFLEASKFGDIPVFGENLHLVSSGYPHPLYNIQVTLSRLEVEAVWLDFELPRILNLHTYQEKSDGALVLENLPTNVSL